MRTNQKVRVSKSAKFHGGCIGYFQFFGEGPSIGCAVITEHPTKPDDDSGTYFVVKSEHLRTSRAN